MDLRVVFVALLCGFVACQDGQNNTTCTVLGDVNGCSTPLRIPFPYKAQFTPSCNSHDVCYRCGLMYSWTQDDCDKGFLNKMKSTCTTSASSSAGTRHKRFIGLSNWEFLQRLYQGWKEATKNVNSKKERDRLWNGCLKIAKLFQKFLSTSDSVKKCMQGAQIYYETVKVFGIYAYRHSGVKDFCKESCAYKLGNPN